MRNKDFIRIINEEVSEFDFLNNDKYKKEQEITDLLQNSEFQKQFITDSITKMRDTIEFDDYSAYVYNDPDFEYQDYDDLSLEVNCEISYKYKDNENPVKFSLMFLGKNIDYQNDGKNNVGETKYGDIAWNDISVNLYTVEGDVIDFTAFDNASSDVQKLFIKTYVKDGINNISNSDTDIN